MNMVCRCIIGGMVAVTTVAGCERDDTIALPVESALRIPEEINLGWIASIVSTDDSVVLTQSATSPEDSAVLVIFDLETGNASTHTLDGYPRSCAVDGADSLALLDEQGQLFLGQIPFDGRTVRTPLQFEGRLHPRRMAWAGNTLAIAADEITLDTGETCQLAVINPATGELLSTAQWRAAWHELSRDGSRIYVLPGLARPGDTAFVVDLSEVAPEPQSVPLPPESIGGSVSILGRAAEVGIVWGDSHDVGASSARSVATSSSGSIELSRVHRGGFHVVTKRHFLYDGRDESVRIVDLKSGEKWKLPLGALSAGLDSKIRLFAESDSDHAIVAYEGKILQLALDGVAPSVVPRK